MESVPTGGAPAPVENVTPPVVTDVAQPEAVKPAAEDTSAQNPEAKKEHWASKRIKEIADDRNYWRDLAMRTAQQQPAQPQRQAQEERTLTRADFGHDDAKYLAYVEKRLEAKAEESAKALAERYRAEQEAIEARARFEERLDAYGKTREDFDSVVAWLKDENSPISAGMADFLFDTEEAGLVAEYLHNNEAEARKISRYKPAKAGKEMQKLEDRLVAERKKAAEKPVTKAPAPAPKIEATEPALKVSVSSPESDKLSMKEWAKAWEREHRKKD